ncbi:hypothetical protein TcasGA2_TC004112 [Tribolium castaneum]|uniref:Secreted protein n=1 Tax=Tribolium castaneum TaxID=7070 RepID=D6W6S2_TRICA|nr:hypothetical protein TcasGA2_TC004112 [Tribolium castaneum]
MLPTLVRIAAAVTCVHPANAVVQQHVYGTCELLSHLIFRFFGTHIDSPDRVSGCSAFKFDQDPIFPAMTLNKSKLVKYHMLRKEDPAIIFNTCSHEK